MSLIPCPAFDPDPQLYTRALWITGIFTLPFNLFGIYCVWTKTPERLHNYRTVLLVLQIPSCLLDLIIQYVITPVLFLPLPLGYSAGLISFIKHDLRWTNLVVCVMVVMSMCSVSQVFHYRLQVTCPDKAWFKMTNKYFFIAFGVIINTIFLIPLFLIAVMFVEEGESIQRTDLIAKFSCSHDLLVRNDVQMLSWETYKILLGTVLIEGILIYTFSVFIVCKTYKYIGQQKAISANTSKMQRKFQLSLTIQIFTPLIFCVIPACIVLPLAIFEVFGIQTFVNIFFFQLSLNGFTGNLVVVLFSTTYLNALRDMFYKYILRRERKVEPSSSSSRDNQYANTNHHHIKHEQIDVEV